MRRIIAVLFSLFVPILMKAQKTCHQSGSISYTLHSDGTNAVPAISNTIYSGNSQSVNANREIIIPVVVHILTNSITSISDEQVHSQIEALNRDFGGRNADLANVPERFKGVVGKSLIRFELAKIDPAGNPTSGIVRKKTNISMFSLDDRIKYSSKGGDDAWTKDHYLNIWVGSLLNSVLGYASVPGAPASTDGVVLNEMVFGTINKPGSYNMGRVAVHEIGHWLGLKHIWGDGYCGDDGIDDTPSQKSYNRGCPSGVVQTCGNDAKGDMYMNFMDLTDDGCMFMFTEGQKRKMRSQFETGAPRQELLSSGALGAPGTVLDANWNGASKVSEIAVSAFKVYPVPATSEITIDVLSGSKITQLTVYNMIGQAMLTVPVNKARAVVDISGLRAGQYMIRADQPGASIERFVKL
ncbi:T9SS type A sorting domain-containing protein [Flavihumibacter sediminis]|nr:T9SS type A sorting domain-containing protein [Flavihumibacter sediminis]